MKCCLLFLIACCFCLFAIFSFALKMLFSKWSLAALIICLLLTVMEDYVSKGGKHCGLLEKWTFGRVLRFNGNGFAFNRNLSRLC